MRAPTTPVICTTCGRELRGTECADGFRIRRHRDTLTGGHCPGAFRVDHQPSVVLHRDTLEGIARRAIARTKEMSA